MEMKFSKMDSTEICQSPKVPETECNVYVNTLQPFPVPKTRPVSTLFNYKIIISALTLLMIGVLTSLCAILYHNNVLFTKKWSEKYENLTAKLMVLEHNAKANQKCTPCEEGWKPLGLKCYYFSTEKLDWAMSEDYCLEKGGHLVIITSQTEQSFVSSKMKESHWIGLNDLETEGKWMWVNNQPLKETDVMFWYISPEGSTEPDNWKKEDPSGENCVALGHKYGYFHKWFDASCCKLKLFICEK